MPHSPQKWRPASISAVTADGLRQALYPPHVRYFQDPKLWVQMQKQGMKSDISCGKSASLYAVLYTELLSKVH